MRTEKEMYDLIISVAQNDEVGQSFVCTPCSESPAAGKFFPTLVRSARRKCPWGTRAPSDYAKLRAQALRQKGEGCTFHLELLHQMVYN